MVNNRDIDKLIVQTVFEMSQAGNSHTEIGEFFFMRHRSVDKARQKRVLQAAQFDGVQLTAARLFIRRHDMIIRSWLRVDKTVLG